MKFSEAVKAMRKQLKITQNELANMLHVTSTTISRWESDKANPNQLARTVLLDFCKTNKVDSSIVEDLKEKR